MTLNFDVHGTLFKYSYDLYTSKPLWYSEGRHPFVDDIPFMSMQYLLIDLQKDGYDVRSLCKISVGTEVAKEEQRSDVRDNLAKYYPNLPSNCYCFCEGNKSEEFKKDGKVLTKEDILFDDYQPNLLEWERMGGTSIKVLNGINSITTWYGKYVDARWQKEKLYKRVKHILNELSV